MVVGSGRPIRVLVVDDSAFMRRVITRILESDPAVQVVGTARDGLEAVARAELLRPDVITLDVEMPRLDGLAALPQILAVHPCPVVMVSSLTQQGAQATVRALALGAVDFVAKPSGAVSLDLDRVGAELVAKVKAAAAIPHPQTRGRGPAGGATRWRPGPETRPKAISGPGPVTGSGSGHDVPGGPRALTHLVLVASSTGGPGALYRLLGALPGDLPAAVVIVQHMPPTFTRALAQHLDEVSGLAVAEAWDGARLRDGSAWVAPGDHHLVVTAGGVLRLDQGPPLHGVRPAADVTFTSVPEELARRAIVLVLTGMGADGAKGAQRLHRLGARVWVQDPGSCVVAGMPGATAALGIAERSGPPEDLARWLVEALGGGVKG